MDCGISNNEKILTAKRENALMLKIGYLALVYNKKGKVKC